MGTNQSKQLRKREMLAKNIITEEYIKIKTRNNIRYSYFDRKPNIAYDYKRKELPLDDDKYVKSFTVDQKEQYKQFFDEYGVVVIRDILTKEECEKSVEEVWDFLERHHTKLNRNIPETWDDWPGLQNLGILGDTPVLSKQFFENRQNEKLYSVYSHLLNSKKLWSNIGRASVIRPTKDIVMNEKIQDKPEWKTVSEWLHLDASPYTGATTTFMYKEVRPEYNHGFNRIKLQGTLSLVDCSENEGGFHCVPGFHKYVQAYGIMNPQYYDPQDHSESFQFPDDCEIRNDIQKVPVRAGSAIIWSSMTPHGTFPNNSNKPRIVQYVHMVRIDDKELEPLLNYEELLPKGFELSELGSKLLGFSGWE